MWLVSSTVLLDPQASKLESSLTLMAAGFTSSSALHCAHPSASSVNLCRCSWDNELIAPPYVDFSDQPH